MKPSLVLAYLICLQCTGPKRIARIAKECGVERMIHVSALNVTDKPESHILPEGSKTLSTKLKGKELGVNNHPLHYLHEDST